MKKMFLRVGIVMAAFMFTMGVNVDEAHAGVVAGIATEWTQIMNNIQLILHYETQIQQYATQLQQAQMQIQHLGQAYKQTTAMVQGIGNGNFNLSSFCIMKRRFNSTQLSCNRRKCKSSTWGRHTSKRRRWCKESVTAISISAHSAL